MSEEEEDFPQLKIKHIKQLDKFYNNMSKEYTKLVKDLKKDYIPPEIINCYLQTKSEQQHKKQPTPLGYIT